MFYSSYYLDEIKHYLSRYLIAFLNHLTKRMISFIIINLNSIFNTVIFQKILSLYSSPIILTSIFLNERKISSRSCSETYGIISSICLQPFSEYNVYYCRKVNFSQVCLKMDPIAIQQSKSHCRFVS